MISISHHGGHAWFDVHAANNEATTRIVYCEIVFDGAVAGVRSFPIRSGQHKIVAVNASLFGIRYTRHVSVYCGTKRPVFRLP